MGDLIKIHRALLDRGENIAAKSAIISLVKEYNLIFKKSLDLRNALKYLTRRNYIRRIFLGYYYINSLDERKGGFCKFEDKELLFCVLNKSRIKWYVGLNSALYLSGENWQLTNIISIVNNKFSGLRRVLGLKVRFYKIKESLIFGLKKIRTKNNIVYAYSLPDKTRADMVYFRVADELIKGKKTINYLKRYPKWVGRK